MSAQKIDFNYTRTDFPTVEINLVRNVSTFCGRKKSGATERFQVTTETIVQHLKSIWREMFQHSAVERNLVHQNDFRYERDDFPAVEINLVRNVSTFCGRKKSGTPERFQVRQKRFSCS